MSTKVLESEVCPVCGVGTLLEKNDHSYEFNIGRKKHIINNLLHSFCDHCETSMFLPNQLDSNYATVQEYKQRINNIGK